MAKTVLQRIADLRAWLFLAFLIPGFEAWSRLSFGGTFIFNPFNVQSIAIFTGAPLLLATGQTFVIISGGIDLSMGFIMGLAAVVAAHAINWATPGLGMGFAVILGGLVAAGVAAIPGAVNGFLVAMLKVPPFIGTLGMFCLARGVAFLLAGGTTVPVKNSAFAELGNGRNWSIPYVVIVAAVFVLVMHFLLSQTIFGQHNYAIGANSQAARRAGRWPYPRKRWPWWTRPRGRPLLCDLCHPDRARPAAGAGAGAGECCGGAGRGAARAHGGQRDPCADRRFSGDNMTALARIVAANRAGARTGIPSRCTAHPEMPAAILRSYRGDTAPILIEATCNQVNQSGGYTGMDPAGFATFVRGIATARGVDHARLILGGDHLGPNLWRHEPAEQAMEKARAMVAAYVAAGSRKSISTPRWPAPMMSR